MSDEVLEQLKEMGEKMDVAIEAGTKAQQLATDLQEQTGAIPELDASVKAAVEASAKASEEAQDIRKSLDAIEKTQQFIEKAMSRMNGADGDNEAKEMEEKAGEETAIYLRTGAAMSDETAEAVVRALCAKSFYGVAEHVRENEIKTLLAGNSPDGGYFIRPERSATMIRRIFETSPMRGIANIETTSSDSLEFLIDDDQATSGGWVGEVQPRGNTDTPQIGMLTIPAHEQFAQPRASQKMLDDAGFDIESWLSNKVTSKMLRTENSAFVTGDGSQKPRGFLSLPAWAVNGVYERGAIEQIDSGVNGNLTGDSVKQLQNSLIEDYQSGAIFGIKRVEWEKIITLKDGNGAYLLDPRSLKTGDDLILLGKRVIFMDDMPVAATDSLSLVYGNFSFGYTIVDRIGFRVIRDNLTDKPFIKFYTTKRTGGDVTNYESLKLLKYAA